MIHLRHSPQYRWSLRPIHPLLGKSPVDAGRVFEPCRKRAYIPHRPAITKRDITNDKRHTPACTYCKNESTCNQKTVEKFRFCSGG